MEIRRTEQRINTEDGQILIERVTDVPLLNKKQVIEHNMITLPLHSYEKLVLERNDRGTYTLTVNLKGNEGLGFNNKASVPIEAVIEFVEEQPTVEPVRGEWEVVHGVMTPGGDPLLRCPICRSEESCHMGGIEIPQHWNFCPNCGADMRGENDVSES